LIIAWIVLISGESIRSPPIYSAMKYEYFYLTT